MVLRELKERAKDGYLVSVRILGDTSEWKLAVKNKIGMEFLFTSSDGKPKKFKSADAAINTAKSLGFACITVNITK